MFEFTGSDRKVPSGLPVPPQWKMLPAPVEPDDPTGCPCGGFDHPGRIFDYIPAQ